MKNLKNKITYTFILGILFIPSVGKAELVPCKPSVAENGEMINKCGFSHLVQLVDNIIDFIVVMTVPISAIMFAFAGVLYISGDPGKIGKAHGIFKNVGFGLLFVLGAWLIVKAVLTGIGAEGYSLLKFN